MGKTVFDKIKFINKIKEQKKKCSLITVTFNRWALTKLSLKSFIKHTYFPHDLIVVDNHSTDGTVKQLKKIYDNGKIDTLILLPKNTGGAGGFNIGTKIHSENEWFQHISNDNLVCPYWLTTLCYITKQPSISIAEPNWSSRHFTKHIRPEMIKVINGIRVAFIPWNVTGMNFHKRVLKKVGYYRDDYTIYGTVDYEWDRRARCSGFHPVYILNLKTNRIDYIPQCEKIFKEAEEFQIEGMTYRQWKTKKHEKANKILPKIRAQNRIYYQTQYDKKWIEQYVYRGRK